MPGYMLAIISIRKQRAVLNGQNTCCLGTMERPKVSPGPDGGGTGGCIKNLDLILWVMGNL